MSHPVFTLVGATLVALSAAAVEDRTDRGRLRTGVRAFAWSVAAVAGGGWAMWLIHG
jgi:hypothetical protein